MLEIAVSLLYFTNKIFLYLEKKSGWLWGMLASSLAAVYFFGLDLYIFLSLEIACLVIMIFGWMGNKRTMSISLFVYGVITGVMLILLFNIRESGWMEFVASVMFMIAFLLIAYPKWKWGWSFLGISHLLMMYILYQKTEYFFSTMQAMSVIVCILALFKKPKHFAVKTKLDPNIQENP